MTDKIKTPLEIIADYGCPIDSYLTAIQYLNKHVTPTMSKEDFEADFAKLVDLESPFIFEAKEYARKSFLYAVQEILRITLGGGVPDAGDVIYLVSQRIKHLEATHPEMLREYDNVTLDDEGNAKPPKGTKGELARKAYLEEVMGKGLSRKDAMLIIAEKAGMTEAGSSTYHAKFKKEYGA